MRKLQAQSEIPIFNVVLEDKSQVFDWNYYSLINHSIELIMLKLQSFYFTRLELNWISKEGRYIFLVCFL